MSINNDITTGCRVIRLGSPANYATGRKGSVVELPKHGEYNHGRARVKWDNAPRTWVRLQDLKRLTDEG